MLDCFRFNFRRTFSFIDKVTQCDRFTKSADWNGAKCWTMNEVYDYLPKDEIARVEKLEFLDERELVKQLFEHYCITFAWINGSSNENVNNQTDYEDRQRNVPNDPLNFDDLEFW